MRFRIYLLAASIMLMLGASQVQAQHAGFVTAGIPPVIHSPVQPFVSSPVQPFVSSPVGPFGVMPAITPPLVSTFPGPNHFGIGPQFVSRFNGVAVVFPHGSVVNPASAFVVGRGREPGSVIGPATTVVAPIGPASVVSVPPPSASNSPAPPAARPPDHRRVHIPAGTSRAQVIQQLGEPAATIIMPDGELLGFSDGAMIHLQNGVVVIR